MVPGIVNCYWGTWANYRSGNGKFDVSNIDANLCTHLSYSFFGINDNGDIQSLDTWLDYDLGFISKAVGLKHQNPKLKVLAVIGGWNEGSVRYSSMAGDWNKRRNFVNSALNLLRNHGFDGLDLDWEYPNQRGGRWEDRSNFVTLLRELKEAYVLREPNHWPFLIYLILFTALRPMVMNWVLLSVLESQLPAAPMKFITLHNRWTS